MLVCRLRFQYCRLRISAQEEFAICSKKVYSPGMNPTKIKLWLSQSGHSREWLSKKLGVAKKTVDGWLSAGRTIPGPALKMIEDLMKDGPSVQPKFTLEQVSKMQEAARKAGQSLEEWTAAAILEKLAKLSVALLSPALLWHLFHGNPWTLSGAETTIRQMLAVVS